MLLCGLAATQDGCGIRWNLIIHTLLCIYSLVYIFILLFFDIFEFLLLYFKIMRSSYQLVQIFLRNIFIRYLS